MRAFLFGLCTWILIASGSFLAVSGLLDYIESRRAQNQIAEQWQQEQGDPLIQGVPPEQSKNSPRTAQRERKKLQQLHSGATVAKLLIPRLDTVLYVVEGTDDSDLKRGPGHLAGTVLPGEDGNCVIAGHRDTHFSVLKNIRSGDEVILERGGRQFRYRVDEMSVVAPEDTASLLPTDKPVLNLITCFPFQYVGSAPKRFIVHADLEDAPLQALR